MANLKYLDKHNMVAFLKKPNESVGFTKVVDFLKGTSLKYALSDNPTIYDSLVKQFWQTATVRTLDNGTQQLVASIDSKEYTITETSVRSTLQLADATGIHNLSDAKIYAGLATLGYVTEGDFVPLLPAMLVGAVVDQGEGSTQPTEPHHTPVDPIPSTSQPPIPSPPHQSPPHSPPHPTPHSPPHSTPHSPPHSTPHYSPTRSYEAPLPEGNTSGSAEDSVQLKELMVLVPKLVNRIGSLEKELKETLGNAVLTLVKKVKTLEVALKRKSKKVIVSESEGEEPEDQGRIIQDIDDDPLVSLVRESMKEKLADFVTPTKASGEAQEEEISPTILEAAKTLSKVASQGVSKAKSTDKGKRYRRRARSMAKNINTGLDAEDEINTGRVEINTGIEDVNTGSTKVDTGRTSISTSSIILSPKNGQREGKARMVEEDIQTTYKTKEQIRQEEVGLEEAIRLQAQMDEEVEVQKAAQFYTEEDWDTIRAKMEANTEVLKSLQGESIRNDDFEKRMVEMINEKKKFYAEQKAKAKRKLKIEFKKLMKSIESFVPMETEARVKRHGLQLEQETSKKQKIDIEDDSITKGKDKVVKEEEAEVPVKKTGKRRKQKARKGINIANTAQDEMYDRVLWGDLKTMFDPPLSDDAIWSLPLQQKIIN
ncbi:hypothetical protein Tco_0364749 [Tanacetum coccineum]